MTVSNLLGYSSAWIYGTNIYKLYEDIVKEYENDWAKDEMDVDFEFVFDGDVLRLIPPFDKKEEIYMV